MIDKNDFKVYIFCPPDSVSGGPEALHQLQYYMRKCGIDAYIVYYFTSILKCPERYEIYDSCVINYTEVEDSSENFLIVPETGTSYLYFYKNVRKCIWWLSVNNYKSLKNCKNIFKDAIKHIVNIFLAKKKYNYTLINLKKVSNHFCGSRYAFDYLASLHKNIKPKMLVEPISKQFYDVGCADNFNADDRNDIILYNPAKPSPIMNKLLKREDLCFKPLKGYTPEELIDLYRQAKLYIDFGEFPGPERIPKESIYNGSCLLVGKHNASENDFDIPIPEFYKIQDFNNEKEVVHKIKYNYLISTGIS